MRFLISVILLIFFFIAPFQGNAGDVSAKPLKDNIESSAPTSKLIEDAISDDYAIAIIRSNNRAGSTTQYRLYTFTNLINSISLQSRGALPYKTKHFVQPYLTCKRIGLKLLFPEHYFW